MAQQIALERKEVIVLLLKSTIKYSFLTKRGLVSKETLVLRRWSVEMNICFYQLS